MVAGQTIRRCVKETQLSALQLTEVDTELPSEQFERIVQEFPNCRPSSDGDIFRNIRLCWQRGDSSGEDMWWARLTTDKAKDLRRLLRNSEFVIAFDNLLPLRGLWTSVALGSLHRLLRLKCHEVEPSISTSLQILTMYAVGTGALPPPHCVFLVGYPRRCVRGRTG